MFTSIACESPTGYVNNNFDIYIRCDENEPLSPSFHVTNLTKIKT